MPTPVTIPLLNPNEPEALLAALHVQEGQYVTADEPLCTLETTKSTADLLAEAEGFVVGLRSQPGQTVRAGEVLCYLAEQPDWQPPAIEAQTPAGAQTADGHENLPAGLRITRPALALARQLGVPLELLPTDRLVTESVVRSLQPRSAADLELAAPTSAFDAQAIVVYGGGGHGKTLVDLLRRLNTYRIVGIVDDGIPAGTVIMGLPVLGGAEALPELYQQGVRLAVNAVGGIGNLASRVRVFQRLAEAGFVCPALAHPSAVVEASAVLAPGVQVFAQAYVGSEARVGFGSIVNTGAIVSHDCVLGDYVNLSPGAILAGEVQVGSGALVGMGATVNLQVKIGTGARIGNGATVKADVPEKSIVKAGSIWPEKPPNGR
jgi:sugar O-acyltransferase (sialic acid O-acetyltransferase NeuD family)